MVDFLLARGAKTNLADDKSWATPLAWAKTRGHAQVAEMLQRAGAKA
jgi:ankyrin repeat protein